MAFGIKRSKADGLFSDLIRELANYTCERCLAAYDPPTNAIHCSHFWGRGNKSVRFDKENVSCLCYGCHRYFGSNPQMHRDFFLKRLGVDRLNLLDFRARRPTKVDEKLMCIVLQKELDELRAKRKEKIIGGR